MLYTFYFGSDRFTLFESCPHGWTHWDLQLNNVLFRDENVSVIFDFDRMRYVYPKLSHFIWMD